MQGWWSIVGFPSHSGLSSKIKPSQTGFRSAKHLHSQSPHNDSTMMLNIAFLVTPGLQHHNVQCQIPSHPRVTAPQSSMLHSWPPHSYSTMMFSVTFQRFPEEYQLVSGREQGIFKTRQGRQISFLIILSLYFKDVLFA